MDEKDKDNPADPIQELLRNMIRRNDEKRLASGVSKEEWDKQQTTAFNAIMDRLIGKAKEK